MHTILLPALIALFAAAPFALAGETIETTATATAAKPWYNGPKGGDARKGHAPSPSELRADVTGHDQAQAGSVAATSVPRYIGPKGGDTRKGHFAPPAVHGNDPAAGSALATPKPWYIGPKGGDTRKGAFRR